MQCNQCGANLPDEARFCLQCGAPIPRPESESTQGSQPPDTPPSEPDFIQPALVGGTFLGLLSSLPLIAAGNCLCCMWVLGGGGIATYMLTKQQPDRKLTYGDGAFAGVLSGLFGAIIATVVSIPVKIVSARLLVSQQQSIEEMFRGMPELEGPWRDIFLKMIDPQVTVATVLVTFISNLILYSLFAMIGGILMVLILQKRGAGLQPAPRQ